MLTKKQRSAAARVLFTGYCRYRSASPDTIIQERGILAARGEHAGLEGTLSTLDSPEARKLITKKSINMLLMQPQALEKPRVMILPDIQSSPQRVVEFVFGHELGHDLLNWSGLRVEHPLFFHKPEDRVYSDEEWEFEWLCDAFAYYFVMYRAGVEIIHPLDQDYEQYFKFNKPILSKAQALDSWGPIHKSWANAVLSHKHKIPDEHLAGMLALVDAFLQE